MVQNLEAAMSASLEQYQSELNRQLAANVLSFNDWGAISALGLAINFTMKLVVAMMTDIIIYASNIEKVEVVRFGKVRRAKLNYLRDRVGKAAKVKEVLK